MDALGRGCRNLIDEDGPAFPPDVAAKISIRMQVPHCDAYTRQIMSRRSTSVGEPISRKNLARKIAEEMKRYLEGARSAGQPLIYHGIEVRLEDLFLCSFRRASGGSWEPELEILVH
ncbi:hypothetical protein C8Q80DRAFT_1169297 [Daedaleopsis nitida]|nr:hypothetical protein C8Q80DRAFT_1169297 [Daedaleopsis nitida]